MVERRRYAAFARPWGVQPRRLSFPVGYGRGRKLAGRGQGGGRVVFSEGARPRVGYFQQWLVDWGRGCAASGRLDRSSVRVAKCISDGGWRGVCLAGRLAVVLLSSARYPNG